ncbi:hypothetical protein [Schleiferilactobacillus perolens]|jgi:hypothetical protein|uniref:Na+-transporting malonate decarboxylase, carboxybiotin decarboxylase subunit, madB n=1 Tax=Schleiferilactobacillus perolens DSM 12744 TaxID=1423792 RepID=A0A0R1N9E0_9LACO|nr:hypothetical protein [Schleiferilactobacillus perolens]KRL14306.1 hypothetical protein FD09_GL001475 [Schleiferilactobacillus perolens DSM 12744]
MFSALIVGHILFGLASFAGSLLLVAGFKTSFHLLTKIQQAGILFTVGGLFATLAFAMGAHGNWFATVVFIILGTSMAGFLAWPRQQSAPTKLK